MNKQIDRVTAPYQARRKQNGKHRRDHSPHNQSKTRCSAGIVFLHFPGFINGHAWDHQMSTAGLGRCWKESSTLEEEQKNGFLVVDKAFDE